MKKGPSWKKTLLSLGFLALLILAGWYHEEKYKPSQDQKEAELGKALPLGSLPVTELSLQTANLQMTAKCIDLDAKLCKAGDRSRWEIQTPELLPADTGVMASFLTSIDSLDKKESIDLSKESAEKREALLKEYGLLEKAETGTLTLTFENQTQKTLWLGKKHPFEGSYYGKAEGPGVDGTVFMISEYFVQTATQDLNHFRDKKIFHFKLNEILSFDYSDKNAKFSVFKKEEPSRWELKQTSPRLQITLGDTQSIENFLSVVSFLEARKFLTDRKLLKGSKKEASLKLFLSSSPDFTVELYHHGDKKDAEDLHHGHHHGSNETHYLVLSGQNQFYEMDADVESKLMKTFDELRSKQFLSKETIQEASEIRIQEFSFKKDQAQWLSQEGEKFQNLAPQISEFLTQLSGMNSISSFPEKLERPKSDESLIKIFTPSQEKPIQFEMWRDEKSKKSYAQFLGKKEIYQLSPALFSSSVPWTIKP